MLSNHLILCCPLLLLPSILPSIRSFPMSRLSDCSPKKALLKGKKMITISILIHCLSPPQLAPSGNEGGKERGLTKGLYFFPSNDPDKPVSQWLSPCQYQNYIQSLMQVRSPTMTDRDLKHKVGGWSEDTPLHRA